MRQLRVNARPARYLLRLRLCVRLQLALLRRETVQQLPTALRTAVLRELEHLGLGKEKRKHKDVTCHARETVQALDLTYDAALSGQNVLGADLDVYAANFRGEYGDSGGWPGNAIQRSGHSALCCLLTSEKSCTRDILNLW